MRFAGPSVIPLEFNGMEPASTIEHLLTDGDLSVADVRAAIAGILDGSWSHVQAAAFLIAMRAKGETPEELAAATGFLMEQCVTVTIPQPQEVLDTAGTGGDGLSTFNISTAAAFAAAACGLRVAKHGNRALSGKCGSSDLLAALGANLDTTPDRVGEILAATGICFMFAPAHHPVLKAVASVRTGLGVRTMFNLLGALANPASAGVRLAGVYAPRWLVPYAEAFKVMGVQRAVVVHAGGMDEFSVAGPSSYVVLTPPGTISEHETTPVEAGVAEHAVADLRIDDTAAAVDMFNSVMDNEAGAARDACALNAGAALYAAGRVETIAAGVAQALDALDNGTVRAKVAEFIAASRG